MPAPPPATPTSRFPALRETAEPRQDCSAQSPKRSELAPASTLQGPPDRRSQHLRGAPFHSPAVPAFEARCQDSFLRSPIGAESRNADILQAPSGKPRSPRAARYCLHDRRPLGNARRPAEADSLLALFYDRLGHSRRLHQTARRPVQIFVQSTRRRLRPQRNSRRQAIARPPPPGPAP